MSIEVQAQNMPAPGAGFAGQVARIDALKLFARALPAWSLQNGATVSIALRASPDGLEIDLGLPPSATPQMADSVVSMLIDAERMAQLEFLVDQMRNVGVAPEVLDPMIREAEELAARLFPKAIE
jgi:hypothetical protein